MTIDILSGAAAEAEAGAAFGAGFRRIDHQNPAYLARMDEAARLLDGALSGNLRRRADFQEALAVTDLPVFLNAVLDREALARYNDIVPVWRQYATVTQVRDFRAKNLVDLLGGKAALSKVGPGTEYPARSVSETSYAIQVAKYGARYSLLWEAIVNDDLDVLTSLPQNLAQAARDTESVIAVSNLVSSSGVNTAFFKSANGNAPTALPLTRENLEAAITAVSVRKDSDGRPIQVIAGDRRLRLVVPPELAVQANRIVNATEFRVTVGSEETILTNTLASMVEVVVEPWLSVVATDNKAATRWFLLPPPNGPRPAVAVAFLRGREVPELRVKADTGNRVGGGAVDPTEGSFDIDAIEFRVRHVLGGATLDPIGTYVSNGS